VGPPSVVDAPYRDPWLPIPIRVADLLSRMTLAEKIGQMTQAERADAVADTALIAHGLVGSLLSGGGSTPAQNTPTAWADMIDGFQKQALGTRLGIPLIYGIDSVHGHGTLRGATVFPHDIGLGASRDPHLVSEVEHITAAETRATGPQGVFSPCLCAAQDDRWGRTYESFGENPLLVTELETAIDGLQGGPGELAHTDRVLATAKHFAGDGDTRYDPAQVGTGRYPYPIDQGVEVTDGADFARKALLPFVPAVLQHDVGSVMPSLSSVDWTEDGVGNPIKMHANQDLITGVLKQTLGFDGLVISDWMGIHQIPDPADPSNTKRLMQKPL
jgi:beta-glucosidase